MFTSAFRIRFLCSAVFLRHSGHSLNCFLEYVTDSNGEFRVKLAAGLYTLEEIEAPKKYDPFAAYRNKPRTSTAAKKVPSKKELEQLEEASKTSKLKDDKIDDFLKKASYIIERDLEVFRQNSNGGYW